MRMMEYADSLHRVRDDIDYSAAQLASGVVDTLEYPEVEKLRTQYRQARDDERNNNPEVWMSWREPLPNGLIPPSGQTPGVVVPPAGTGLEPHSTLPTGGLRPPPAKSTDAPAAPPG